MLFQIAWLLALCLIIVTYFLPGYLLLTPLGIDRAERFVASFGVSALLMALLSVLTTVLIHDPWLMIIAWAVLVTISLLTVLRKRLLAGAIGPLRPILLICCLAFAMSMFAVYAMTHLDFRQNIWSILIFGIDYTEPLGTAKVLLEGINVNLVGSSQIYPQYVGTYTFFDRPPLLGVISAFFMSALPDQQWFTVTTPPRDFYGSYVAAVSLFQSLVFLPGFMLIKKIFNTKIALCACLFFLVNPFRFWIDFWNYKEAANYFILLSLYFLISAAGARASSCRLLLAGLFGGTAYLMHPFAIAYLLGALAYGWTKRARYEPLVRNALCFLIPILILAAVWELYVRAIGFTPFWQPQILERLGRWSGLELLEYKGVNLLVTFWNGLGVDFLRVFASNEAAGYIAWDISHDARPEYHWLLSFSGALSMALFPFSYVSLVRNFTKILKELYIFFTPLLVYSIIVGIVQRSFFILGLTPTVFFMTGLAVKFALDLSAGSRILIGGLFAASLSEFLLLLLNIYSFQTATEATLLLAGTAFIALAIARRKEVPRGGR